MKEGSYEELEEMDLGKEGNDQKMEESHGNTVLELDLNKHGAAVLQAASQCITASQDVQNESTLQILLINIDENKLAEITTLMKYLAVSYIWGKEKFIETTTDQRVKLAEEGSLSCVKLPRIVRDAISFTRKMHYASNKRQTP